MLYMILAIIKHYGVYCITLIAVSFKTVGLSFIPLVPVISHMFSSIGYMCISSRHIFLSFGVLY
jgi:hypothetical protein